MTGQSTAPNGVVVASSTRLSADAGAEVAAVGGNAVDAAIGAAWVATIAEPGICAPGCGGFVTVWAPAEEPVTIDGYIAMPGRGAPAERFGGGTREITLEYGGGVTMQVGHGSVGTPGGPAALALASSRFGRVPWSETLGPAIDIARAGFALSPAARYYLGYSGTPVFGWHEDSRSALHRPDGALKGPEEAVRIPHLPESLQRLADYGAEDLYTGELARVIARDMEANGGLLTLDDLEEYRPIARASHRGVVGDWRIATNPPPAIGGAVLVAMLGLLDGRPHDPWTEEDAAHLVDLQARVLGHRRARVDEREDMEVAIEELVRAFAQSPSTVHISAVDTDGLACAITLSAGYGSGVMVPGTGLWMNNCLGEVELNRRGLHSWPVGGRLVSNMAPTVARRDDEAVLAIGSPGADRIPTAILQAFANYAVAGMGLQAAIDHPRLHVDGTESGPRVASEPGLPEPTLPIPRRVFQDRSMYFGGVGAAAWSPEQGLEGAADPRRAGAVAIHEGA